MGAEILGAVGGGVSASSRFLDQFRLAASQVQLDRARDLHHMFHALWSAAVGQPGYDKAVWKEMDEAMSEILTDRFGGWLARALDAWKAIHS